MRYVRWVDMKQMNLLTKINNHKSIILQSLLSILIAIVFLYIYSFKTLSIEEMENSCALIKYVNTYSLKANGKTIAWFNNIGNDLEPKDISTRACEKTIESSFITACWINKYAILPSCNGTMLTIQDSTQSIRLQKLNGRIRPIIKTKIAILAEQIKLLENKKNDIEYYLSIHNVNDEGYTIIANHHDILKKELSDARITLNALQKAIKAKHLSIIRKENYTLLYKDEHGKNKNKTCRLLTKGKTSALCLIQTSDKITPQNAKPLYFNKWFAPKIDNGREIINITEPFCILQKQLSGDIHSVANSGTIENNYISNMPLDIIPDISPIFTSEGRPMGIIYKGDVLSPRNHGSNYKNLLQ